LKQNKLSPEQHTYLIRATIDAIFSSFVSLAMKINLQFVLILLYTLAADEIIDEGLLVVQEKLKGNEVNLYPPAFFLLQAIINIPMNYQAKIASWFEGLSDTLVEVGGRLAHEIIEELKSTEESQEKQLRIYLA